MQGKNDTLLFSRAMARLFSIYRDEVTDTLTDAWWNALAEYPIEQVLKAMQMHVKDPVGGKFRPVPANVIEHLATLRAEAAKAIEADRGKAHALLQAQEDRLYSIKSKQDLGILTREQADDERAVVRAAIRQLQQSPEYLRLQHNRATSATASP